jgi:hypothetical protein
MDNGAGRNRKHYPRLQIPKTARNSDLTPHKLGANRGRVQVGTAERAPNDSLFTRIGRDAADSSAGFGWDAADSPLTSQQRRQTFCGSSHNSTGASP